MMDDKIVEMNPEENVDIENTSEDGVEQLQSEVAQLKDQLLRTLAESENMRKRAEKEREDTARYAVTSFARDLLAVADNLRRAMESVPEDEIENHGALKNLMEGLDLTEKELLNTFQKHGMKKVDPLGEVFDHNLHQAMYEVEAPETAPGTVMHVMQAGYVIHDRLLRPAMVGVAKATQE